MPFYRSNLLSKHENRRSQTSDHPHFAGASARRNRPCPRRAAACRITENRFLRNPPIAAESDGGYVIPDGATRTTALRKLNALHLLVQIVEYGDNSAKVEAWNHVLPNVTVAGMVELIQAFDSAGVRQISIAEAQQQLQNGEIHGYIFHQPGAALALTLGGEFDDRIRLLRTIVAMYKHHGEIYRLAQADLEHIIAERHEHSAVMVFPQFTPEDIRRIAVSPEKLPAGITRHIIPWPAPSMLISRWIF